ncbi:serine/threonine-protein kinase Nek4 isoform X2 [Alosa sapidissima]|uniref:serine/threonine-protein kinase Nek4 isoform X2 n=1 Tax=Alosa sapidissima TaxID=34773 RepID=UPI001C09BBF3|nr:serine/threonine-protein kinase Nek4 isoform X2 [Alosa sapidissima]
MDSYIFVRVVGKGSYGEVHLVKHKTDRKQYVIKKLNLKTSSRRERRSAEQEAQLLSQLRHPNIVTYRESWEGDDCQLYIVMGYCEGGDLYHRLKQQKGELLPERQVVEWFVQIAMALQYLHEKRILHRDLKTQNIFLTKTNIIKVGDLGIAKVLENQNDMASTLIGTPYYMSPELFSNKPYNHKSDVWALGCCVYEMSTLKHAFNAKDMNSLAYRIVEGKLPQMPSKYDPQLGELIRRMLCKRPEDRPDVKQILRQPFIKQQIAMFLEATKEKAAKSRNKAIKNKPNSGGSVIASPVKNDLPSALPQIKSNTRARKREENNPSHHSLHVSNGEQEKALSKMPLPPKSPTPDILNTTGHSIATISNIDIAMQPLEFEEPKPRKVRTPKSVPDQKPNDGLNQKRTVSKRTPKPDASAPQPHPRKLEQDLYEREERRVSNGPISQCPVASNVIPASVNKHKPLVEIQPLSADMDSKEDTVKLLQEAALNVTTTAPPRMPDAAYLEHYEPELVADVLGKHNSPSSPAIQDMKDDTMTLLKEADDPKHVEEAQGTLESTEKLLEPFVPVPVMEPVDSAALPPVPEREPPVLHRPVASSEPSKPRQRRQRNRESGLEGQRKDKKASRPLPPPPVEALCAPVMVKNRVPSEVTPSESCPKDRMTPVPLDRPLSARERRRLRQSQEHLNQPVVPAMRRASYDVALLSCKQSDQPDYHRAASVSMETSKDRHSWQRSDEEECNSSTSSTDRSEGDGREGKNESCEMQDLVQMMTQTLRMDSRDAASESDGPRLGSRPQPEFKINYKYKDTLVLHGKAMDVQEDFQVNDFCAGDTSGPAKIRRAVEQLRTDVVKGLGVKLLDRVLDIMQEEDEEKREQHLLEEMGEEKYKSYAVMVHQLKFFEDVAFKG